MMMSGTEMSKRLSFYKSVLSERVLASHVKRQPALWPIEAYEEKIKGLSLRGFEDPKKMIMSSPAVLGYSFETIDAKIKGLLERGFTDPVHLITVMPALFGYSFKNIDRKMRFARRVHYPFFVQLIEYSPLLIGVSFKRYMYTARVLRDGGEIPSFSLINKTQRGYILRK